MWRKAIMELTDLKNRIMECFKGNPDELRTMLETIERDEPIYPFNEYEHMICYLIHTGHMSYEQYLQIRDEYISLNPNLQTFEISAPRQFGENFAQNYIMEKSPAIQKASKRLDSDYRGQYDLWLDGIKIEVKASRAVDSTSHEPLYMKALSLNTQKPFLMNFQQLKPQCCDVFVWLAVFRDIIKIWVINSDIVANHLLFSQGQHRGNIGNEGQLHMTNENIHLFNEFELSDDDIVAKIREQARLDT